MLTETTVVSNTRMTYYNTAEAFSMCVGTVGQLNQQCSEDQQQLRAHSFLLWRTALSQWFSSFSASESPEELVKPETAGPQPQKF